MSVFDVFTHPVNLNSGLPKPPFSRSLIITPHIFNTCPKFVRPKLMSFSKKPKLFFAMYFVTQSRVLILLSSGVSLLNVSGHSLGYLQPLMEMKICGSPGSLHAQWMAKGVRHLIGRIDSKYIVLLPLSFANTVAYCAYNQLEFCVSVSYKPLKAEWIFFIWYQIAWKSGHWN